MRRAGVRYGDERTDQDGANSNLRVQTNPAG